MPAVPSLTPTVWRAIVLLLKESRPSAGEDRPMTQRSYRGLLWGLAVAGLLLDQGTKYGVFRWLYTSAYEGRYEVVPGAFRLIAQFLDAPPASQGWRAPLQAWNGPLLPRVNQGALFGLGNDYSAYANGFFAVVSVTAALAIAVWSTRKSAAHDGWLCAALGLILAGTLGNLFDRVVFGGVRDFLYFYWIEWPVFNVADCFLVGGAGLLLLQAFLTPAEAKDKAPEPAVAAVAE
jgi:lipoprotein signal peptidase